MTASCDRTPPRLLPLRVECLPLDDLAPYPHAVTWALEWREGKNGNPGAWTKLLKNPRTGRNAKGNDPTTWGWPNDVLDGFDRFGFVVWTDDPFTFLDVDDGVDCRTRTIKPWAQRIIDRLPGAYWEYSTTGGGLKGLIRGTLPPRADGRPDNRIVAVGDGKLELFSWGKFTALTGHRLAGGSPRIGEGQAALDALYRELCPTRGDPPRAARPSLTLARDDHAVLARVLTMAKGRRLHQHGDITGYASQSEADLALLACYVACGASGADQLDRLYTASAFNRDKWTEREDYRERTIAKALDGHVTVWDGWHQPVSATLRGVRTRHGTLRVREASHA